MTAEHVWPDWLSAELPAEELTTFTFEREGQAAKVWKGRPTSTTVRAVCGDCNNGWLSNLETAARPLLVPLTRGARSHLTEADQRTISAWAFKTAVMVDQMNPIMAIRREHLEHLQERREPHATVQVFVAACDAERPEDTFARTTTQELHLEDGPRDAFVATLAIRDLALQVTGSRIEGLHWQHEGPLVEYVRRVFPPTNPFDWPAGPALPREGLLALATHWVNA